MNISFTLTQCIKNLKTNCTKIFEKVYTITSLSENITLLNGYTLSILSFNTNSISILLENDNNILIRNVFISYPFEILLNFSTNCCYHLKISNLKLN